MHEKCVWPLCVFKPKFSHKILKYHSLTIASYIAMDMHICKMSISYHDKNIDTLARHSYMFTLYKVYNSC